MIPPPTRFLWIKQGSRRMLFRFIPAVVACCAIAACANMAGNEKPASTPSPAAGAASEPSIHDLIVAARDDRSDSSKRLRIVDALMRTKDVYVIPAEPVPRDPKSMEFLEFARHESDFIPVFSDRPTFDEEAAGTGYEGKAIAIDTALFAKLLKVDDTVIVNPGDRPSLEFKGSEFKSAAARVSR